jgi:hypothetical protein
VRAKGRDSLYCPLVLIDNVPRALYEEVIHQDVLEGLESVYREIAQIIDEAVELYNDLKHRASHPEGSKKAFYTALTKEMFEKLDELCEKLSAVVSKQA